MNSPTTHFVTSRRMGIYEPMHQISMWGDFEVNGCQKTSATMIVEVDTKLDNQSEDTSHETQGQLYKFGQETSKHSDKVKVATSYLNLHIDFQALRRLAQNREAARKSRLRKKAHVQQLEASRLKLIQLEQELERARHQGLYLGGGGLDTSPIEYSGSVNSDIAVFEKEYGQWVEKHKRQISDLRTALTSHMLDNDLRILVEGSMNHYGDLFRMKATAAKADVFYLMSGIWKTSAERFFLWIGGFRPSELLKVLVPQLDLRLTEEQVFDICNLKQSCQQAEDALSQGMEKLQQILAEAVASGQLGEASYIPQMTMEKLEALVRFVNQVMILLLIEFSIGSYIVIHRQIIKVYYLSIIKVIH
ncbi:hypothetical protein C3L33_01916, partial [Rhododendron williamsianum]